MIATREEELRKDLQAFPQEQHVVVLLRAIARASLVSTFENIYGAIFGSQILGLRRLNAPSEVSIEDAEEFFGTEAKAKRPEAYRSVSFDDWLAILINRQREMAEGALLLLQPPFLEYFVICFRFALRI